MPLRFANICIVSTHSRLKAAGWILSMRTEKDTSFNTQPPEGGWAILPITKCCMICFNTQPPEGGWFRAFLKLTKRKCFNTQPPEGGWKRKRFAKWAKEVSTHSRLKAAGFEIETTQGFSTVSTHSRLKAAGGYSFTIRTNGMVSTHSRLKAAGDFAVPFERRVAVSTHSRLKAAGPAGRQRLHLFAVSTHSRLKAAGPAAPASASGRYGFNTQPPEGGWPRIDATKSGGRPFQHTAA